MSSADVSEGVETILSSHLSTLPLSKTLRAHLTTLRDHFGGKPSFGGKPVLYVVGSVPLGACATWSGADIVVLEGAVDSFKGSGYWDARALAVTNVASSLAGVPGAEVTEVEWLGRAALAVAVDARKRAAVRVIVVPEVVASEEDRLALCLRVSRRLMGGEAVARAGEERLEAVLEDLTILKHQAVMAWVLGLSQSVKDACLLLKVWLRRRGMEPGQRMGTWTYFHMVMLVAHLHHTKAVSKSLTALQIFGAVLTFIAANDLSGRKGGIAFHGAPEDRPATVAAVRARWPRAVVFVDPEGLYNMAHRVTRDAYRELQAEARATARMLAMDSLEGLSKCFGEDVPFVSKFDAIVRVPLPPSGAEDDGDGGDLSDLVHTLSRGLGDRVTLLATWCGAGADHALIGLLVDHVKASRRVEMGPPGNDEAKVAEFIKFWGPRAELRRFKDGSIVQSVVWAERAVVEQIVETLVGLHHPRFSPAVVYGLGAADALLEGLSGGAAVGANPFLPVQRASEKLFSAVRDVPDLPLSVVAIHPAHPAFSYTAVVAPQPEPADTVAVGTPLHCVLELEESSKWPANPRARANLKAAFYLRMANGLRAHGLTSLVATSYLDVFVDGYVFRLEIHVGAPVLGSPAAKMALRLEATPAADKAEIARASAAAAAAQRAAESARTALASLRVSGPAPSSAAFGGGSRWRGSLYPSHVRAMRLMGARHPSLPGAARLAKLWVASMMLSAYVADEVVELLVARVYELPSGLGAPGTAQAGLLRFLELVGGGFDFAAGPVVVIMEDEDEDGDHADVARTVEAMEAEGLTGKEAEEAIRRVAEKDAAIRLTRRRAEEVHLAAREAFRCLPATERPAIFLATSYDPTQSVWTTVPTTASAPITKAVLNRLTALARAAAASLSSLAAPAGAEEDGEDAGAGGGGGRRHLAPAALLKAAFRVSSSEHDLSFRVDQRVVDGALKIGRRERSNHYDLVPTLVAALVDRFGHLGLFLYNKVRPEKIAVMFKPRAFEPTPIAMTRSRAAQVITLPGNEPDGASVKNNKKRKRGEGGGPDGPDSEEEDRRSLIPNLFQVLADIQTMGAGVLAKGKTLITL